MRFKITITFLVFLAITSCYSKRDKPVEISHTDVEQVANDFFKSLSTGDTLLMKRLLSSDFYMFEHDQQWNQDSLLALMPRTLGRIWELSDFKITSNQAIAHVSYFNNSLKPLNRSWLESMLIVKAGDSLKIKFMHSTKLYLK